ncbi:MAG: 3'-5' exonuclease domain-containing protein 2 [SAR324 cluster bacterium]|nr:3'-5' exonuclease domain-containing protein 2 [SAR324 cluster bacterium]
MVNPSLPSQISKEEINTFPLARFDGEIHLITEQKDVASAVAQLRREPILGFDTETRPAFKKGESYAVSLLQLATAEDVFLFRLNLVELSSELKTLLEDESIYKFGIAIHDDLKALKRLSFFKPGGFIDLSKVAKKLGMQNLGLRSLAAIILKVRVSKGARLSNWQGKELTLSQLHYAATDAWICREIYIYLRKEGRLKDPIV